MRGARARPAALAVSGVLLSLPGVLASLLALPGRPLWDLALALPLVALPTLLAVARLQAHQRRAAWGLGAGRLDRLRWIWLPQLAPGIGLSLLVAGLLAAAGLRLG